MPTKTKAPKASPNGTRTVTAKVLAADLGEALDDVSKVTLNVRNAAVYRCILTTIRNGKMTIRGTNLVVFVERTVDVDADGEGTWLIIFEQFYHFVKNVTGTLTMSFGKTDVVVTRGRTKASAKLRDHTEFMIWPKWTDLQEVPADAAKFIEAIRCSIPSVSAAFADPSLYNISLSPFDRKLTDVQASNNHRYQIMRIPMQLKGPALVPLNAAIRLAEVSAAKKIALSNSLIGVQFPRGRIYCNLSADPEKYPQFAGYLPKKFVLHVVVDKDATRHVVTLAEGFADKKYHRLSLTLADKKVTIASSVKSGDFKSVVVAKTMKGKALTVLVDAQDVKWFMDLSEGKDIHISFTGPADQILFTDPSRPNLWFVAYPLIAEEGLKEEEEEANESSEAVKE